MKELYVIFFRYDRGEEYKIYHVGTDRTEMKKHWKDDLVNFFSYGPDDVSQLWFIKLGGLSQEQFDKLSSTGEDISDEYLKTILVNGKEWDSFGWDRNECPYLREELGCCYGTDMYDLLSELYDEDELDEIVNDDVRYEKEVKKQINKLV